MNESVQFQNLAPNEHSTEDQRFCKVCKQTFSSRGTFFAHECFPVDKKFICDVCQKAFCRKWSLTVHYRIHTGNLPHVCEICQRKFALKCDLTKHILRHETRKVAGETSVNGNMPTGCKPCDVCKRRYICVCQLRNDNFKDVLKAVRNDLGDKVYICNICNAKFKTSHLLTRHLHIHVMENKKHTCEICQKNLPDEIRLKDHICRHKYAARCYRFFCDLCQKSFQSKTHMLKHTGEKPYKCDLCAKRFFLKSGLKMHLFSHTGEKPYACDFCENKYSDRSSYNKHVRLHKPEELFSRGMWDKTLKDKPHYVKKMHLLQHAGDKRYECNICKKCYSNKYGLTRHSREHSEEKSANKSYECNICKKCYSYKCSLTRHSREHLYEKSNF